MAQPLSHFLSLSVGSGVFACSRLAQLALLGIFGCSSVSALPQYVGAASAVGATNRVALARQTNAMAILLPSVNHEVPWGERMTLRAALLRAADAGCGARREGVVHWNRDTTQVRRIDAARVLAFVMHVQPISNGTDVQRVRQPVGQFSPPPPHSDATIALVQPARPVPALRLRISLNPSGQSLRELGRVAYLHKSKLQYTFGYRIG